MPAKRKTARSPKKRPARPKPPRPKRQQPESLRLRGVTPTYTVNDIQRSLAYYRDTLGFTVKERWEEHGKLLGLEVVAGAVTIGLSQDDFAKGRDRVKGIGQRLWCTTAEDLDAFAARIHARGGTAEGPAQSSWGARVLTVTDPDGFKLSFTQEA